MSDDRPEQPDEPRFNPQSGWPEPSGEHGGPPPTPPPSTPPSASAPSVPPPGQPYPSYPSYPSNPSYPPAPGPQGPYGQQYGPQYGPQYGQYPTYPQQYGQGRPNHPQAGLALGLGLGAVVGALLCGLPLLLSPFAWAIGHRARKEIRESGGRYDGEGMAQTGMILGIVGTVLLALLVVAVIVLAIALAADSNGTSNL